MKSLLKITENIVEKSLSQFGSIQNHIFFNWAHIAGQYADKTIMNQPLKKIITVPSNAIFSV